MRRRSVVVAVFALAAGGSALGAWYLAQSSPHPNVVAGRLLPVYGRAPAYVLTDQLGRRVSSSNFTGKVQVVTFLFPYCTEYCPLIAGWLVRTEKILARDGLADRVQLVSFNVDPAHTGPPVLRAFMSQYGWNPNDTHWEYLTGAPGTIRRIVTGGYHISYRQVKRKAGQHDATGPHAANPLARQVRPDYDIEHNDDVILIDPRGRIRAVIASAYRLTPRQVVSMVRKLWNNS
jgi:cytochrome oxidase Cu insertion factor (SCO1/SenC/PrrC family)